MISMVVGLGNPGPEYMGTRHNVGFDTLDQLAITLNGGPRKSYQLFDIVEIRRPEKSLVLVWPMTFMNRSGEAVLEALTTTGRTIDELLIVVDDFHLPLGRLRLRSGGSEDGHNGLLSISQSLARQDFARLRLGIGPKPDSIDSATFVLDLFSSEEAEKKENLISSAVKAVEFAINHSLEEAMNITNADPAR